MHKRTVDFREHATKLKVFPVRVLTTFEAELLVKAVEGWMLTLSEKAQLSKIIVKLKGQG